jgi:5'-3' exoribonuclease 2
MGIPSFYRWLSERYPLAVTHVIEEAAEFVNGVSVPLDSSRPNPNDIEFDNLYLDMNGIIHPCFHPEGLPAPGTYQEVFEAMFKYIDRIFSIVRPRKLLYMAIDGVAPRAKMNQQRARRFRAAKDAADEASRIESSRGGQESEGQGLEQTKKMDSNIITPGTEFMSLLSSALQHYVHLRINKDPGWRGIKVILSDANVPGEGEHKIMSYIRLQRNLPGFNANTRHCLYGLDADLIMLALATHEIHFSILREDMQKALLIDIRSGDKREMKKTKWDKREEKRKSWGRKEKKKWDNSEKKWDRKKKKWETEQEEAPVKNIEDFITSRYFQFLHVWTLRDYLVHDLSIPDPKVTADFERLIDDFVFMCIFVGNDFLPHVPSLEISEGAIDLLMAVYKEEFVRMGGYLTNSFEVNLGRVEHFVQAISSHENTILRKRSQVQKEENLRFRDSSFRPGVKKFGSSINHVTGAGNPVIDQVKLGEEGWKERYYAEKFEANTNDDREKARSHSVLKYIEGICWVMHYYYQGVCSWQWFYPYHYAPFASDFCGLDQLEIHFVLGKPFKPFDQLMGVLPAASAHALPFLYQKLMTDSSSPILDFYPNDFELDMNGKRFLWQAVCKLPFIKESRLLLEIAKVEHSLTEEEKRRNSLGLDILFIHKSHPLSMKIFSFWKRNKDKDNPKLSKAKVKRKIDPEVSGGMNGYIYISDEPVCPSEINPPTDAMVMITENEVISVFYNYPSFHPHIPKPPEGVNVPEKFVRKKDILPRPVLWHDRRSLRGRVYSEGPIPNSISGSRLGKLAHRLVCKYYVAKQPKSQGCMEVGSGIIVDPGACQSNLKLTVTRKELDSGTGNRIGEKRKRSIASTKTRHKRRKENRAKQRQVSLQSTILLTDNTVKPQLTVGGL